VTSPPHGRLKINRGNVWLHHLDHTYSAAQIGNFDAGITHSIAHKSDTRLSTNIGMYISIRIQGYVHSARSYACRHGTSRCSCAFSALFFVQQRNVGLIARLICGRSRGFLLYVEKVPADGKAATLSCGEQMCTHALPLPLALIKQAVYICLIWGNISQPAARPVSKRALCS
jgi:hypothetical protein